MTDGVHTGRAGDTGDEQDDQALELRSSGASFSRIAKEIGFDTARQANDAFHRALVRRPAAERTTIRNAESARLDALEQRVRRDTVIEADDRAKRLRAIDRLRNRLLTD